MPQNREQIEKKSDAPQQGADSQPTDAPVAKAQLRLASIERKMTDMRTTVAQRDVGPTFNQMLDEAGLRVVQTIEDKANALKNLVNGANAVRGIGVTALGNGAAETLSSVMAMLRAEPSVRTAVSPKLVDALVTIGKANKDSVDPTVRADVDELRQLVIELQGQLKKQAEAGPSGMPSIVINNNLGPQVGPQAAAPVAPEKKAEQQGWQEEGLSLMQQVASINRRIKTLKEERGATPDSSSDETFKREVEGLVAERQQLLRTVNALVDNARKPSEDRGYIAATPEETTLVMNGWINAIGQDRGALRVVNGSFKIL